MSDLVRALFPEAPHPGRSLVTPERSWTRRELDEAVYRCVSWLRQRGLSRGHRLLLQGPKDPGWLIVHLAALRLGVATCPINPRAPEPEVQRLIRALQPDLSIIIDPRQAPAGPQALSFRQATHEMSTAAAAPHTCCAQLDDLALIGATSGTTGTPRPVPLRHRHLLPTVTNLIEAWRLESSDVLWHGLPLFHIHGLVVAQYSALAAGMTAVWQDRFEPVESVDTLHREGVTVFMGVPTLYRRLVQTPGWVLPASVRLCTSGSAPLPVELARAFHARTGQPIIERYGMTEVGIVLSNPLDDPQPGTVGFPLPGTEVRVVDADGEPLPPGQVGELCIRGPSVFEGYEGHPEATRRALRDGWMCSGDLAQIDPEGRVSIQGRRSSLILSGGFNVYPSEVEACLLQHPGVQEAGVVGLPDPDLGEVPVATVVGDPSALSALHDHCRAHLAAYKCPRFFAAAQHLPRNDLGKLQHPVLQRWWTEPQLRPAVDEDLDFLVAHNLALARETEGLSLHTDTVRRGVQRGRSSGQARYFVAEVGGGLPIGQWMVTTEWSDWRDGPIWWVQSVYVAPPWRRRGVLRRMLDHTRRLAREAGVLGLRLYVDRRNLTAQQAYRALGWSSDHYQVFESPELQTPHEGRPQGGGRRGNVPTTPA